MVARLDTSTYHRVADFHFAACFDDHVVQRLLPVIHSYIHHLFEGLDAVFQSPNQLRCIIDQTRVINGCRTAHHARAIQMRRRDTGDEELAVVSQHIQ